VRIGVYEVRAVVVMVGAVAVAVFTAGVTVTVGGVSTARCLSCVVMCLWISVTESMRMPADEAGQEGVRSPMMV